MPGELVIKELARKFAAHDGWRNPEEKSIHYGHLVSNILHDTRLIRYIAEIVGLEVKEKPLRYVALKEDQISNFCRVLDTSAQMYIVWICPKAFPKALGRCQEIADELNKKQEATKSSHEVAENRPRYHFTDNVVEGVLRIYDRINDLLIGHIYRNPNPEQAKRLCQVIVDKLNKNEVSKCQAKS